MSINPHGRDSFTDALQKNGLTVKRNDTKILQINVGKRCNQRCEHCHVNASPDRTEIMNAKTADRILDLLAQSPQLEIIDITGGAPELNPNFRKIVTTANSMNKTIIDRTNLTVFFEQHQKDTPQFLADNGVQVYASLPCYTKENVDEQRGKGTFDKSIRALQFLNKLGYGNSETNLVLNLIYNPIGAYLPGAQLQLEHEYKIHLREDFNIEFNQLLTITNMPIARFASFLKQRGELQKYMQLLVDNFNPDVATDVMCSQLISISWDGHIYDCDFNQMLEIPLAGKSTTIWDINNIAELSSNICFANHCYGCTAGEGSSCQGALNA
jgi:radical SAM/Cys-rich protein